MLKSKIWCLPPFDEDYHTVRRLLEKDVPTEEDFEFLSREDTKLVWGQKGSAVFGLLCALGIKSVFSGKDGKQKENLVVEANFFLEYKLLNPDEVSKDDLETFARINGVYTVWPYWREFVQSSCSRLQLPPLVLDLRPSPMPKELVLEKGEANASKARPKK
jgi:hypothetical protein